MPDIEQLLADALRSGIITPVEFEEFWREYDRLCNLVLDAQALMAVPRIWVPGDNS